MKEEIDRAVSDSINSRKKIERLENALNMRDEENEKMSKLFVL
jgi:hypothetical protein